MVAATIDGAICIYYAIGCIGEAAEAVGAK